MCKVEESKPSGISNSKWEAWPPLGLKRQKEETALSSRELKELELFRRNFPGERWRYSPDCTNAQSKQEGPKAEMHALPSPSPCPPGSWWFPLLSKYTQKQRARSLRIASP